MSLFNDFAEKAMGMLSSSGGSDSGLLGGIIGSLTPEGSGGLGGLLKSFQEKGLGDAVASWVGKGENLPISAEQIQSVLGNETIQNLASNFGISTDEISSLLAQHLPGAVDTLTPDGSLPEEP
jgi:uncharacterized protein YidB (DUF937 family)